MCRAEYGKEIRRMEIRYRHEVKHMISYSDMLQIRMRMMAIARPDPHAINGKYHIRSLYFDNITDKALREKIDGVNRREKFRIRYYNLTPDMIHLEKKSKFNGLGTKYSASLNKQQAQAIVEDDIGWMADYDNNLIRELYLKMQYQGLKPKTIVDYMREPFVYEAGNVRVTLDYDIRTGLNHTDFLNPECLMIPAADAPIIMEVKWDDYLPGIIKDAVQIKNARAGAFSKYAQCRIYG